jgi:Tfp pilus assembly protein PilN
MSTLTDRDVTTRFATLPRVNLLPPEIGEQRKLQRIKAGLGVGVLGAVGVIGVLTVMATSEVSNAQHDLDAAKAQQTTLQAQVAEYAEVPLVNSQLEAAHARLTQAMGKEVRWSYVLNDLSLTVPSKVWLDTMTVTQDVDGAASAAAAVPGATSSFLAPGVATMTFTGHGYQHNDVAAWLDALAKQKGLTQPYFTSSVKQPIGEEDAVTFSSQATVTEDALSKRWTQKAGS